MPEPDPDSLAPSGDPATFLRSRPGDFPGTTRARLFTPPESAIGPTIDPLPTQIVSAGYVVRLRILAYLDDGRPPRLSIDRLPTRASFDENPDGSHTLYWPTDDEEQGEHRFRITAVHPDDETRASGVDALIIVGNSNGGTARRDVPFVAAPASSYLAPTVMTDLAMKTRDTGAVELEDENRSRNDARDPYSTYDDHPAFDPQADFDITYDPQDPNAGASDDEPSDFAFEFPSADVTLD